MDDFAFFEAGWIVAFAEFEIFEEEAKIFGNSENYVTVFVEVAFVVIAHVAVFELVLFVIEDFVDVACFEPVAVVELVVVVDLAVEVVDLFCLVAFFAPEVVAYLKAVVDLREAVAYFDLRENFEKVSFHSFVYSC